MPRYLRHITLTTGHTRDSYRAEIARAAYEVLGPVIEALLAGERPSVPGFPAYVLTGTRHGRCLMTTVWGESTGAPVATIGVAEHARCGAVLWQSLHDMDTGDAATTDREQAPSAPWIAARLHVGAALHAQSMHWMGDFERCLGWAWVRRYAAEVHCERCECYGPPIWDRDDTLCSRCGLVL